MIKEKIFDTTKYQIMILATKHNRLTIVKLLEDNEFDIHFHITLKCAIKFKSLDR